MEFRDLAAKIFGTGVAEQIEFLLVGFDDAAIGRGPVQAHWRMLKEIRQFLLAAGEFAGGLGAGGLLFDLAQGAAHRQTEPAEFVLEHVIGGALLDGVHRLFVVENAGDKNERRVQGLLAGEGYASGRAVLTLRGRLLADAVVRDLLD